MLGVCGEGGGKGRACAVRGVGARRGRGGEAGGSAIPALLSVFGHLSRRYSLFGRLGASLGGCLSVLAIPGAESHEALPLRKLRKLGLFSGRREFCMDTP